MNRLDTKNRFGLLIIIVVIAAGVILSGCGSDAAGGLLPADEERCRDTMPEDGAALAAGLAEALGGQGLMAYDSDEYVQLFDQAAVEAGVKGAAPLFYLAEGDPGTAIATVDWCGQYWNNQLLVIDPDGTVTPIGEIGQLASILDIQWLDGTWAVITNVGSGMFVVQIHLVGQEDGRWVQLYPPEGSSQPLISVPNWPMVTFVDGYQSLTVAYLDDSAEDVSTESPMVEHHFEWQADHYVEIGGE